MRSKYSRHLNLSLAIAAGYCCLFGLVGFTSAEDVCSSGTGNPPFISAGASPNLLLVLDNSGSMLDMAYIDQDTDGAGTADTQTQCFDKGYNPTGDYAGYFENDSWYKWQDFSSEPIKWVPPWKDNYIYKIGDIVYANGAIYRALTAGTSKDKKPSNGYNLSDDVGVQWDTLSDSTTVEEFPTSCPAVPFVSYENSVYQCSGNIWTRLEGGQFVEQTKANALNYCTGLSSGGKVYQYSGGNDLCLAAEEVTLFPGTKDEKTVQKKLLGFVARGNYLNWASASKFDIQKKILTGGKYDPTNKELVGESRGCAGSGFVKQVEVLNSSGVKRYLELRVRGANDEDRVGNLSEDESLDHTTRIEIIGVTSTPFDQSQCQAIIEALKSGKNITQNLIDNCLGATNEVGTSQAALSTTVNVCRQLKDTNSDGVISYGEVPSLGTTVAAKCQDLFTKYGYKPADMSPEDGGYVCYGEYDSNVDHTKREGYLGRCWSSAVPGWIPSFAPSTKFGEPTLDCIADAMIDFCGDLKVPEVIDPSDQATTTTDYWNVPAMLIDGGVMGQLGLDKPLAVMKVNISYQQPLQQVAEIAKYPQRPAGPRGVLYDVAEDIRLGIMVLNNNGAKYECDLGTLTTNIDRFCPDDNRDGATVIAQIAAGMFQETDVIENWDHYKTIVERINATPANAWTPLAEAMYTALSYYGQNEIPRLHTADFKSSSEDVAWADPVQFWCQENNVLILTEGASTADINSVVESFALNQKDPSTLPEGKCSQGLQGSTYLDNLTWFGQNAIVKGDTKDASNLYSELIATNKSEPGLAYAKQPVTTHIIATGSLRTDGVGECNPTTLITNAANFGGTNLLQGEDPRQLEQNLKNVLTGILGRASSGSAASVISSARSGEGAVYQAVFWPQVTRGIGKDPLTWIGDVHGFFIDDQGRMWDDAEHDATQWSEDKNGNGILDSGEDIDPDGTGPLSGNGCLDGDRRIFFYYDGENTKICFNDPHVTTPPACNTDLTDYCDKSDEKKPIKEFNDYLWSANGELQEIGFINATKNRNYAPTWDWDLTPTAQGQKRYIFTWNDLNNNGIVEPKGIVSGTEDDEIIPLDETVTWSSKIKSHHSIFDDFQVADETEMVRLVEWLRGLDSWHEEDLNKDGIVDANEDLNNNDVLDYVYRCRRDNCDPAMAGVNPEWRLGDVIYSTPKLVAQPAEAFHTIYRDPSYAWFVKRHRYRRNMIIFGANDGMLHAVNGGFYNDKLNKFYKNLDLTPTTGVPVYNDDGPALGTEMWAYVPYNLQPHLKCLTDPDYGADDASNHKYYVDKEPRIFDMRIFTEEDECKADPYDRDCIHPQGWGTVLVGALRFGGAPIIAADEGWSVTGDKRKFISSYFILDITDPERPPTLLGELTTTTEKDAIDTTKNKYVDLGFSTPMPGAVVMRDDSGASKWYLIFGNGPTTTEGENTEQGKLAVLPLELNSSGVLKDAFRIPNGPPTTTTPVGVIPVKDKDVSSDATVRFVSDMISLDFDVESKTSPTLGALYKTDAVYFGTVDGAKFTGTPGDTTWPGGGRVFRLVTRDTSSGSEVPTTPDKWYIEQFIDAGAPVTGSLSVGWDEANYWIYFGTGRFLSTMDKSDPVENHFFGVKEPLDDDCEMTWDNIDWKGTALDPSKDPGMRGLVRTDNIKVIEHGSFPTFTQAVAFCPSGTVTTSVSDKYYCDLDVFLDPLINADTNTTDTTSYYSFNTIKKYIAGEKRDASGSCANTDTTIGVDGWYRLLQDPRERVIGQSALLGGLVTFTSYQPYDDLCTAEGVSSLYGVHYQTGTAWYENVFGTTIIEDKKVVQDKYYLGVGLTGTPSMHSGGVGADSKAFVQSSTGEIIEIEQENLPIEPPRSGRTSWCDDCD